VSTMDLSKVGWKLPAQLVVGLHLRTYKSISAYAFRFQIVWQLEMYFLCFIKVFGCRNYEKMLC
jgi:hypothetical protein